MTVLPGSADAFQNASWSDILPYYAELAARPLDRADVESWLQDWSMLESLVAEATALAGFAYASDTADPQREEAQLRFSSEIAPQAEEQRTKLQQRLVNLDYVRPGLETTVQRFRNQMELFSPANVPLHTDLAKRLRVEADARAERRPEPLDASVPPDLRNIVEKTLEKDPADRYQSARDLVVDLRRVIRQTDEHAAARRSRTRAVLAIAMVSVLLAAVVITVLPVLATYIIFQRQLQGSVSPGLLK